MAIRFSGSGQSLEIVDAVTGIDVTQRSIGCWINAAGHSGTMGPVNFATTSGAGTNTSRFLSKDPAAAGDWRFQFAAVWSGTNGNWLYTPDLNFNQWYHVLITYDGGSTTNDPVMYLDGTDVSGSLTEVTTPTGTLTSGTDTVFIGENPNRLEDWNGRLAELAFWSGIQTASTAAGLAQGYSPLFFAENLQFYSPLIRSLEERMQGATWTNNGHTIEAHPPVIYPAPRSMIAVPAAAAGGLSIPVAMRSYRKRRIPA